jgi:hypothetical protein
MSVEVQILELLIGQKVLGDDGKWRVYDEVGVELADPGGILWRANPGSLLMWPREDEEAAKSGGTLRLQRVLDGKVSANGSTTQTRTGQIRAVGADWTPVELGGVFAGGLVGARARTRGAVISARGGSTAMLRRGSTWNTSAATVRASAGASCALQGRTSLSFSSDIPAVGAAYAQLVGTIAISSAYDATARGQKRLTTKQIVALTRL